MDRLLPAHIIFWSLLLIGCKAPLSTGEADGPAPERSALEAVASAPSLETSVHAPSPAGPSSPLVPQELPVSPREDEPSLEILESNCGTVEWSSDLPKTDASLKEWEEWWSKEIHDPALHVDRELLTTMARQPETPDDSFWLMAVLCGRHSEIHQMELWGVDAKEGKVVTRFREYVQWDLEWEAAVGEGARITAQDLSGNGVSEFIFETMEKFVFVFPDHSIRPDWYGQNPIPELQKVFEEGDGEKWLGSSGESGWAIERYNGRVTGTHTFTLSRFLGGPPRDRTYRGIEPPRSPGYRSSGQYWVCRRGESTLALAPKGAGDVGFVGFEQTILAPAGQGDCFEDNWEDEFWSETRLVGTISGRFEFIGDEAYLFVTEEIDHSIEVNY